MWSCVNIPAGQYFNMLGHTDFWLENRLKWWTSSCSKIWCWNQQNQSKSHLSALIFLPAEPIYSNISRADHNNNNNNNNNNHHHHPHPDDFFDALLHIKCLKEFSAQCVWHPRPCPATAVEAEADISAIRLEKCPQDPMVPGSHQLDGYNVRPPNVMFVEFVGLDSPQ